MELLTSTSIGKKAKQLSLHNDKTIAEIANSIYLRLKKKVDQSVS